MRMRFSAYSIVVLLSSLMIATPLMVGCTGQNVAQDIVNWTPALQSAVSTVDTAVAALDPPSAAILAAATAGFDVASNLVVSEAQAYLNNPGASLLSQLQTGITTLTQQINAATLAAAKITNAASQAHALAAINAVATIAQSILALTAQISGKTALNRMAAQSPIKLAMVEPYENFYQKSDIVAAHYQKTQTQAAMEIARASVELQHQGF